MIRLISIDKNDADTIREAIASGKFELLLGRDVEPGELLFGDEISEREFHEGEKSLKELMADLMGRQDSGSDIIKQVYDSSDLEGIEILEKIGSEIEDQIEKEKDCKKLNDDIIAQEINSPGLRKDKEGGTDSHGPQ